MKKIKMNVVDIRPLEEVTKISEPMISPQEQFGIVKAMTEVFIRPPYEHDNILKEKLKDIEHISFISTANTIRFSAKDGVSIHDFKQAIIQAWRLVKTFLVPQRREVILTRLIDLQFLCKMPYGETPPMRNMRLEQMSKSLAEYPADCIEYALKVLPIKEELNGNFPYLVHFTKEFMPSVNFRRAVRNKIEQVAKSVD